MSQLNLYNKVSISMTGHDVQLLRAWLPGNWVKVTEFNWFCVQFWLQCCSQAITLSLWPAGIFFYPSWNRCQQNTATGWFTQLNYFFFDAVCLVDVREPQTAWCARLTTFSHLFSCLGSNIPGLRFITGWMKSLTFSLYFSFRWKQEICNSKHFFHLYLESFLSKSLCNQFTSY